MFFRNFGKNLQIFSEFLHDSRIFKKVFRNYLLSKMSPMFARNFLQIFPITSHSFFKIYSTSPFYLFVRSFVSFIHSLKFFGNLGIITFEKMFPGVLLHSVKIEQKLHRNNIVIIF